MSSLWTSIISGNGAVLVGSSPDGVNWTDGTGLVWGLMPSAGPGASLAGYDNGVNTQLYCAFVAGNNTAGVDTGAVLVSNSLDGVSWTGNTARASAGGPTQGYTNIDQLSATAPSLAAFNVQLYCALIADDGTGTVLVCSTPDGVNWTGSTIIGQFSAVAPSLAVFNGQLYLGYVANDGTNNIYVTSTAEGTAFTGNTNTGQSSFVAPSLAPFNGQLSLGYVADDGTNNVYVTSSADGLDWTGNTNTGEASATPPSLAVF